MVCISLVELQDPVAGLHVYHGDIADCHVGAGGNLLVPIDELTPFLLASALLLSKNCFRGADAILRSRFSVVGHGHGLALGRFGLELRA
ncbi:MAG: hypothetical protein AAB452_00040 [Patescibacteria group bacterium]